MMEDTKNKPSDFLKSLVADLADPVKVWAYYQLFSDPSLMKDPGGLTRILCIEDSHLSDIAKKSLEVVEGEVGLHRGWVDFKWKLLAFLTIQDIFPGHIMKCQEVLTLFRQWYFYYEAKYILTEATLCGLNGFGHSCDVLMRPFLEFSVLQNYFFRRTDEKQDYSLVETYFVKKNKPRWNTALNGCLPSDSFCKPIRKRLDLHFKGLSENEEPCSPTRSLT